MFGREYIAGTRKGHDTLLWRVEMHRVGRLYVPDASLKHTLPLTMPCPILKTLDFSFVRKPEGLTKCYTKCVGEVTGGETDSW